MYALLIYYNINIHTREVVYEDYIHKRGASPFYKGAT